LTPQDAVELPFLSGGGEAAAIIARHDWSKTSLGPIASWPPSLKSSLSLILRSPVPIVTLWGEDGVMIYNDAYSEFAGGRHPGLFGSKVREGWPEVADFNDNVMQVGLSGGTLAYRDQELTLYRNGEPEQVWMNLDYSPLIDETGRPAGVMGIVVETTAKIRVERELRGERESLHRLFEQAPGFIALVTGPSHSFTMVNEAFREMIGYRDVIDKTAEEAFPEAVRQGFPQLLDQVYRTAQPYVARSARVALRHDNRVDERYLDFVCQPVVAKGGDITGIFIQGQDVTDRKRHEFALRESEERFRLAAETAPVMLWMGDEAGRCLYLNKAQRDFWGVGPKEVAGFDWSDTIHPEDRALLAPFHDAMKSHRSFSIETRMRRADGVYRSVTTNGQPRFGPRREFVGMIGVNVDMTEARQAEAELQALNATLEQRVLDEVYERSKAEDQLRQFQKMEAVGQLTGGIAHDFNNMLAVILGGLNLLQRKLAKGETDVQRFIEGAIDAAQRAASLTQRLLAFSRQQPLSPEPINPNRMVADMSELLARTLGEQIVVQTVLGAGLWQVKADPGQLENALLNLSVNARDAMPNGGRLTIETSNVFVDDVFAREFAINPGQYVLIAVADAGEGMAPDVIAKAFDPFYTTKGVGKGTGLGLSQVYGFVRQSGGHVKIHSEVGVGTTVKIYLPRYYGSGLQAPPRADQAHSYRGSPGETIMVVEDEDKVRALSVEALRDLGYSVVEAGRPADALRLLEQGQDISLLFTDVVMPEMSGRELAELVRGKRPGIKVLYTTGYTRTAIVHDGILDPGTSLLTKPFSIDELATKVRSMLDG
jgi:PAS domain S-box-containing protein